MTADLETQWEDACRHAGYVAEQDVWRYDILGSGGANGALHIKPKSDAVWERDWPLTPEQIRHANNAGRRAQHRILLRDVPARPRLGLIRHELEHARQFDASEAAYSLMMVVQDTIAIAYRDADPPTIKGSAGVYNAMPHEVDANRAARALFDERSIQATDQDCQQGFGNLWRESGPYDPRTLPQRSVAFAAIFPHAFGVAAEEGESTPDKLLRDVHPDAAEMWQAAAEDGDLQACAREALALMPSLANVERQPVPALAWFPSADRLRAAEAIGVSRYGW